MTVPLFTGNVIAVIWDFDQTLIPGYQQVPLFREYGIDSVRFWEEVEALGSFYAKAGLAVSQETLYLNHLLTYVEAGPLAGLNNAKLGDLGGELPFYAGMPDFLAYAKKEIESIPEFVNHEITVEHYIVSTGLRQMILGSRAASHIKDVWANEFIEAPAPPGYLEQGVQTQIAAEVEISQIGYFVDNTIKTRAIWEINKGVNVDDRIGVNDHIDHADRRVPLQNMLYVADGPSDIPVFSILNHNGGRTLGVYNPDQDSHFRAVKALRDQKRVQHFAEANYEPRSGAHRWIMTTLEEMATNIVRAHQRALDDRVTRSSKHVN